MTITIHVPTRDVVQELRLVIMEVFGKHTRPYFETDAPDDLDLLITVPTFLDGDRKEVDRWSRVINIWVDGFLACWKPTG